MVHATMTFFENGNEEMLARTRELNGRLLQAARRSGYAPYRSYVDYMDTIADGFDYSNNALRRFQEVLKDAVDPRRVFLPPLLPTQDPEHLLVLRRKLEEITRSRSKPGWRPTLFTRS